VKKKEQFERFFSFSSSFLELQSVVFFFLQSLLDHKEKTNHRTQDRLGA